MNSINNTIKTFIKNTDKILLVFCIVASGYGTLMVHSATLSSIKAPNAISRDTMIMVAAISIGLLLSLLISLIDYEIILKIWPFFTAVCLILMFLLFFIGDGPSNRSDAKSWIQISGISFQPSELLKIGFILTFSLHIHSLKNRVNEMRNVILLGLHGGVPVVLVIATGDLGSALVFVAIFIGMLFMAGLHLRYFAAGIAVCLAALPLLWIKFFSDFQKYRFLAVYYSQALPEKDFKALIYQQQQSLNAIGSGQLLGKGLFQGTFTQNNLIPVDESDMIFSVIGEELGFVGVMTILIILSLLILRIISIGHKTNNNAGGIICYGTALMIGSQAIINIGMCLKLLPSIGITLPFFSAGGSSNLCVYIGIGIILSIYRANQEIKPVNFRLSHIRTPFSET